MLLLIRASKIIFAVLSIVYVLTGLGLIINFLAFMFYGPYGLLLSMIVHIIGCTSLYGVTKLKGIHQLRAFIFKLKNKKLKGNLDVLNVKTFNYWIGINHPEMYLLTDRLTTGILNEYFKFNNVEPKFDETYDFMDKIIGDWVMKRLNKKLHEQF